MNIALKEWAVVIEALASARQHFLLRKGGIAEGKRGFELQHREFLLYPTSEHQQIDSLRPEFHELFASVQPKRPDVVAIHYFARVTDIVRAPTTVEGLESLAHRHIWAPSFLQMRYRYRPDLPLVVVILRLYQLEKIVEIPEDRHYAGCRSWVTLNGEIAVEKAAPVEPDASFEAHRKLLLQELHSQGAQGLGAAADGLQPAPAGTTAHTPTSRGGI